MNGSQGKVPLKIESRNVCARTCGSVDVFQETGSDCCVEQSEEETRKGGKHQECETGSRTLESRRRNFQV